MKRHLLVLCATVLAMLALTAAQASADVTSVVTPPPDQQAPSTKQTNVNIPVSIISLGANNGDVSQKNEAEGDGKDQPTGKPDGNGGDWKKDDQQQAATVVPPPPPPPGPQQSGAPEQTNVNI